MLNYKSYTGSVETSVEDGVLHGCVLDIKDVITFEGTTIEELKQAFQDSVDDYLEFCQEMGSIGTQVSGEPREGYGIAVN